MLGGLILVIFGTMFIFDAIFVTITPKNLRTGGTDREKYIVCLHGKYLPQSNGGRHARKLAKQRGIPLETKSAGVSAVDGMPVSHHAESILRDQDIQDRLVSKPLTANLVEWADLILTLTQSHKQYAIRQFPHAADKMHTLKEFVEDDRRVLDDLREQDSLYARLSWPDLWATMSATVTGSV